MSQGVPGHLGVSQGLFGQKWFFLTHRVIWKKGGFIKISYFNYEMVMGVFFSFIIEDFFTFTFGDGYSI